MMVLAHMKNVLSVKWKIIHSPLCFSLLIQNQSSNEDYDLEQSKFEN